MADTLPLSAPPPSVIAAGESLVGTKLNGFIITGTVSSGGMGVVYEARHPVIGRRAAVKVIRPDLWGNVDLSVRFLREACVVSAVKHRNVVEILDFGALPDGAQYMMMEFLEGETLAEIIARSAPMPPAEALQICDEILAGLSAAHQVGVVHRDLKPANIVLMKQSSGELIVKLLDFGLARQQDTTPEPTSRESLREMSTQKSSLLAGTPEYISPEQASGEQVGAQGDLYCLGVILYEMLSGRLPFNSTSPWELLQHHRLTTPAPLTALVPGIHPQINDLVMRLLKKDPAERPMGAKAAGREVAQLKALVSGIRLPDTVRVDRSRPVELPRSRRTRVIAGIAAAAVIGLTSMGLKLVNDSPQPVGPAELPSSVSPAMSWKAAPPPPLVEAPPVPRAQSVAPPALVAIRARPRAAPVASVSCLPDPTWRRAIREQVEDLEKLSLSKMKDDAPPSEVAKIKQRARDLAKAARSAEGSQCQQVETDVHSWRVTLR